MTHGICKRCNAQFMEADFLIHRKSGYCTLECSISEPPGKSSAEGRAWKDKISLPSLREKLTNQSNISLPIRNWQFDMVHYPAPKGWQIENWRLTDAGKPDVPGLYISRSCGEYFWQTVPYLGRDPKRVEDVDSQAPDHAADAVRYGCLWKDNKAIISPLRI